jgi:hypothetical protein
VGSALEGGYLDVHVPASSPATLNFAFAKNPKGIVLASMFSQDHIEKNCAISGSAPDCEDAEAFAEFIRRAG